MPTALDNAMKSKNFILAFGGIVSAAAAWSIWGTDLFPAQPDPSGDPEKWTHEEMRRWLEARGLLPGADASKDELLERIRANMRIPRR